MPMTTQDDNYYVLVDFLRDSYLALSGAGKQRMLTELETLLLQKTSGLLEDFTTGGTELAKECERRFQQGAGTYVEFQCGEKL